MTGYAERAWRCPRWLYPASVVWCAMAGPLLVVLLALCNVLSAPDSLWPSPLSVLLNLQTLGMAVAGAGYGAVFFWVTLRRARSANTLIWAYPLALILPVVLITVGYAAAILLDYMRSPAIVEEAGDALMIVVLIALVVLAVLLPMGVISGLVFFALGRSHHGGSR